MMDVVLQRTDIEATLECWDADADDDDLIGSATINVEDYIKEGEHSIRL